MLKPRETWEENDQYRKQQTRLRSDYFDIAKNGSIDVDKLIDIAQNLINLGMFIAQNFINSSQTNIFLCFVFFCCVPS